MKIQLDLHLRDVFFERALLNCLAVSTTISYPGRQIFARRMPVALPVAYRRKEDLCAVYMGRGPAVSSTVNLAPCYAILRYRNPSCALFSSKPSLRSSCICALRRRVSAAPSSEE